MKNFVCGLFVLFPLLAAAADGPSWPEKFPLPAQMTVTSVTDLGVAPNELRLSDAEPKRTTRIVAKSYEVQLSATNRLAAVRAYAQQLEDASWSVVVGRAATTQSITLTARRYNTFSEQWIQIEPSGKDLRATLVLFAFAAKDLVFGEGEPMDVMRAKFKGKWALVAPTEADLQPDDDHDFAFLLHTPGMMLHPDLTKHSSQLHLAGVRVSVKETGVTVDIQGPTLVKKYAQSYYATSAFKQFMAYRLALENAGWQVVDDDLGYFTDRPWLLVRYDLGEQSVWGWLQFGARENQFTVTVAKRGVDWFHSVAAR